MHYRVQDPKGVAGFDLQGAELFEVKRKDLQKNQPMYETEANYKTESLTQIPSEVISAMGELRGKILARTVLPWSEHCTECVWPSCYSTCELYLPREDQRCRRFVDGMVRIECPSALNSYLLKIRFKRWGKLWTPGNVRMFPSEKAQRMERRDYHIGKTLHQLPLPIAVKQFATGKRYVFKKRMAQYRVAESELQSPTCFLLECYNPQDHTIRISLTMRSVDQYVKIPFQELIELTPGFHRVRISSDRISNVLDLRSPFNIEIIPNDVPDGTTLYFGITDFVQEAVTTTENSGKPREKTEKKVKCVVWDLDNTLWHGILVEDGPDKLRLKPGITELIQELDRHGVLHSIASKNNAEEALQTLKHFGLADYFLYPQISWQPKSHGIQEIARRLNVGIDTLLFIDDQQFELEQVTAIYPDVQLLKADDYPKLLQITECQAPATDESAGRRKMYQMEEERQVVAENFGQDYMGFLKHCDIQLTILPLRVQNLERVHELTQRTNQMNFSGNRYDREVLAKILSTPYLDTYVLDCSDRFGSYGVTGFCVVDAREPRMTDLMFSCRIQSKRVEHAFVRYIICKYIGALGRDFYANYRKTPRNAFSGRVFLDIGMKEVGVSDGVTSLIFSKGQQLADDGIVRIVLAEEPAVAV